VRSVAALSQRAVQPELRISEAEVNPLVVMPEGQGALAVAALIMQC